ncbi:jg10788 [Pararge aegeria aegeria]|uniref:Jg10788 protein n=1 Tax=Pararge aegeria aegeria TaxID=348720 RepID=A0A8S4SJD5_9NEOP|nr:jg10788 [Pararge aegeria aegeria]
MQPITKAHEKIIVRGVQVTNKDSAFESMLKDYTRFVPPTTLSIARVADSLITEEISPVRPKSISKEKLTNIDEMANRPKGNGIKYGHDRNLEHDNYGPPMSRQYAPITPVSFTQRKTPHLIDPFMLVKTPTRTTPFLDLSPSRTSEHVNFKKKSASRSTLTSIIRTSIMDSMKSDEKILRKSNLDIKLSSNRNIGKEACTTYNDLFYNDDDSYEKTTRKRQQSFIDNNELDSGLNSTENEIEIESEKDKKIQSFDINDEDDDYDGTKDNHANENDSATITTGKKFKTIENEHYKKKLVCTVLKLRPLSFSSPLTLHEIVAQLKQWAEESPVAKWLDITKGNYTIMENPIYMILVDDLSSGQIVSAKKTVMIVAGIQGRDHHAVTAAMYVLYQLIERSEAHADLLSKFRFWIIPVFNPDGYDYSMTFPHMDCQLSPLHSALKHSDYKIVDQANCHCTHVICSELKESDDFV